MTTTKKAYMRKGMAMLDLIISLGLAGLLIAGVIWMAGGAKSNLEGTKLSNKITVLINGIEKAKSDYNNDAYIATANQAVPDILRLKYALGGTKGTKALAGWKYSCSAGTNSVVQITSQRIKDADVLNGVIQEINSKYTDWVASKSGNTIVVKRNNSNCQ